MHGDFLDGLRMKNAGEAPARRQRLEHAGQQAVHGAEHEKAMCVARRGVAQGPAAAAVTPAASARLSLATVVPPAKVQAACAAPGDHVAIDAVNYDGLASPCASRAAGTGQVAAAPGRWHAAHQGVERGVARTHAQLRRRRWQWTGPGPAPRRAPAQRATARSHSGMGQRHRKYRAQARTLVAGGACSRSAMKNKHQRGLHGAGNAAERKHRHQAHKGRLRQGATNCRLGDGAPPTPERPATGRAAKRSATTASSSATAMSAPSAPTPNQAGTVDASTTPTSPRPSRQATMVLAGVARQRRARPNSGAPP